MNLIPILSVVILTAVILTTVMAVGSYLASMVRETSRPEVESENDRKRFFVPYVPDDEEIS